MKKIRFIIIVAAFIMPLFVPPVSGGSGLDLDEALANIRIR